MGFAQQPKPEDFARLTAALRARDAIGALLELRHLPSPWREACRLPLPAWDESRVEQPHPVLYVLAAYCSYRSFRGDATKAEIRTWRTCHDECLAAITARWRSDGPRAVPVYLAAAVNLRNMYDAVRKELKAVKKQKAPKSPTTADVSRVIAQCCDDLRLSADCLEQILLDLKAKAPVFGVLADALAARAGMSSAGFRDQVAMKKLPKAALP